MKKAVAGIFLAVVMAAGAFAQDQDAGLNKKQKGKDVMAQLNLTDEQKTALKAIRKDLHQQMAELKKNEGITVKEWKSRQEVIRKEHRAKVANLLTDDQKAGMKKLMEDRKANRRKHSGHHGTYGRNLETMEKELSLTGDQVAALKKNREEALPKLQAIRNDKSKTEEQKKAEVKEFKQQQRNSLKSILTQEQWQKLQQHKNSCKPAPVQS